MLFALTSLSAEERLILLCLRSPANAGDSHVFEELLRRANQSRLLEVAKRNQVERPVAQALAARYPSGTALNPAWRSIHDANRARVIAMETVATELFTRLTTASLRAAMFESAGVLFASDLPRGAFGSGDFDILVEPGARALAETTLTELGLHQEDRSARFQGNRREFRGATGEGEPFWLDIATIPFERGRLPLRYVDPSPRWLARRTPSPKNADIYTLQPDDLLAQVAVHTSLHRYVQAPGLRLHLDVDRMVSSNRLDWRHVERELQALGFTRRAFFSLVAAAELLDTQIPDAILRTLDPGWIRRRATSRAIRAAIFAHAGNCPQLSLPALLTLEAAFAEFQ